MRHQGEANEYQEQRTREIMAAYKTIMGNFGGRVSAMTIYEMVAYSPASRFFITKEWAYRVVRNYKQYQGQPNRRARMYREIYRRVAELAAREPDLSLPAVVEKVVKQPAPEMYLTPVQIMRIIKKESKRQGQERLRLMQQRLGLCSNKRS